MSFRHLVWLLPFLAIPSAKFIREFLEGGIKSIRWLFTVVLVMGLCVELCFAGAYSWLHVQHLFGLTSTDEYFMTVPHYGVFQRTKDEVDKVPGKVLVILASSEVFYLDVDYISADPKMSALIDYSAINDVGQLKKFLEKKGVSYILVEDAYLEMLQTLEELRGVKTSHLSNLKYLSNLIENNCELIFKMKDKIIKNRLIGYSTEKYVSLYHITR